MQFATIEEISPFVPSDLKGLSMASCRRLGLGILQRKILLGSVVAAIFGCSAVNTMLGKKSRGREASESQPLPTETVTYSDHIAPILKERCLACHGPDATVFSLADYDSVRLKAERVVAAVLERRMPQWLAAPGYDEYQDDPSLSQAQLELFQIWQKGGYQAGSPKDIPANPGPYSKVGFTPTVTLPSMGDVDRYQPVFDRQNEYRCFLVPIPSPWRDKAAFVDAVRLEPGQLELVHHMTLYTVSADIAKALKTVDDFDPRPGYGCNGDSLPSLLNNGDLSAQLEKNQPGIVKRFPSESSWLYHWAPGMHGAELPKGTGIRLDPGTALVMQYHFYAVQHAAGHGLHGTDQEQGGKISLRLVDRVEKPSMIYVFSNNDWYDSRRNGSLVVPPKAAVAVQSLSGVKDMVPIILAKTGLSTITQLEIHSANLHMHTRGVRAETWLESKDGESDVMLVIPAYSYYGQRDYFFKTPKVIPAGAFNSHGIGLRCSFYNPQDITVYGGLYSEDEMCINFAYVAAVGAP
jgi:hypothetical protein